MSDSAETSEPTEDFLMNEYADDIEYGDIDLETEEALLNDDDEDTEENIEYVDEDGNPVEVSDADESQYVSYKKRDSLETKHNRSYVTDENVQDDEDVLDLGLENDSVLDPDVSANNSQDENFNVRSEKKVLDVKVKTAEKPVGCNSSKFNNRNDKIQSEADSPQHIKQESDDEDDDNADDDNSRGRFKSERKDIQNLVSKVHNVRNIPETLDQVTLNDEGKAQLEREKNFQGNRFDGKYDGRCPPYRNYRQSQASHSRDFNSNFGSQQQPKSKKILINPHYKGNNALRVPMNDAATWEYEEQHTPYYNAPFSSTPSSLHQSYFNHGNNNFGNTRSSIHGINTIPSDRHNFYDSGSRYGFGNQQQEQQPLQPFVQNQQSIQPLVSTNYSNQWNSYQRGQFSNNDQVRPLLPLPVGNLPPSVAPVPRVAAPTYGHNPVQMQAPPPLSSRLFESNFSRPMNQNPPQVSDLYNRTHPLPMSDSFNRTHPPYQAPLRPLVPEQHQVQRFDQFYSAPSVGHTAPNVPLVGAAAPEHNFVNRENISQPPNMMQFPPQPAAMPPTQLSRPTVNPLPTPQQSIFPGHEQQVNRPMNPTASNNAFQQFPQPNRHDQMPVQRERFVAPISQRQVFLNPQNQINTVKPLMYRRFQNAAQSKSSNKKKKAKKRLNNDTQHTLNAKKLKSEKDESNVKQVPASNVPAVSNVGQNSQSLFEDDEETKELRLKIEEQKKIREKILKLKERRRKEQAAKRLAEIKSRTVAPQNETNVLQQLTSQQQKVGQKQSVQNVVQVQSKQTPAPVKQRITAPSQKKQPIMPPQANNQPQKKQLITAPSKTNQSMKQRLQLQSVDQQKVVVLRKNQTGIKNVVNTNQNATPKVATQATLDGQVIIHNLSSTVTGQIIRKLCVTVGPVNKVFVDNAKKRALVSFNYRKNAVEFQRKYDRYMLDLSVLSVCMVS